MPEKAVRLSCSALVYRSGFSEIRHNLPAGRWALLCNGDDPEVSSSTSKGLEKVQARAHHIAVCVDVPGSERERLASFSVGRQISQVGCSGRYDGPRPGSFPVLACCNH